MARITIFTGRFGSGKTEMALNYAVALGNGALPWPKIGKERAGNTRGPLHIALIDLDIVTPYFRSREMALNMEQLDVEVIAPWAASTYLDLPVVSPQILGMLQNDNYAVVLDVGGDAQGARALGQFSPVLKVMDHDLLMVVNPYRPFTGTVQGIAHSIQEIEAATRLAVNGLVSNPNLIEETTQDIVEHGHAVVEAAGKELGLPVAFIAIERSLAQRFPEGHFRQPVLPITRWCKPPWAEREPADWQMVNSQ